MTATFASKAQLEAMGDQKQDRLTAGEGISISGGVISSGSSVEEVVHVTVTTNVSDVSVEGLQILVYYNSAAQPSATITTDADGMASLRVPTGYRYRLVFPSVEGCVDIGSIEHVATMAERSIEVELVEPASVGETVTARLQKTDGTPMVGIVVTLSLGGEAGETATTDANGQVTFPNPVPVGTDYTVTVAQVDGYYIRGQHNTMAATAERGARAFLFIYRVFVSGVFVVDTDGDEYSLEDFEKAVTAGTRTNEDARLIKISTDTLQSQPDGSCTFAVEIDVLRNRSASSKQWSPNTSYTFTSVPANGNSTSARFYYDGQRASALIQQEGDQQQVETPAIDWAMSKTVVLREGMDDEITLHGFLGSIGQWAALWAAKDMVDDILLSVRPTGSYLMSTYTTSKWSSTQDSAGSAWEWGSSASNGFKYRGNAVVPFFAY